MSRRRLIAMSIAASILLALLGVSVTSHFSDRHAALPSEGNPSPIVAFYGDSYTLGTGASDPERRWSSQIARERDWTEFNPSVNGLGFINNRSTFGAGDLPDLVIDSDPDIVFITMGLNDNFSYDASAHEIKTQIDDDFERISSALPHARVIVVEPFWYTSERPRSVDVIISWVRSAAATIGADYIPGASLWIEGHPEWMAEDGLHPNDLGYAEMARRMNAELAVLGL